MQEITHLVEAPHITLREDYSISMKLTLTKRVLGNKLSEPFLVSVSATGPDISITNFFLQNVNEYVSGREYEN